MKDAKEAAGDLIPRKISTRALERAIDELKRLGKTEWGASYYSQLAPTALCETAGRPRQVQYGALISWLKRLSEETRPDPEGAIALVAHLTHSTPDATTSALDPTRLELSPRGRRALEREPIPQARLLLNCPSVVHDYRFVLVGELPQEYLYPAVFVQPLDGSGYWYPQVARHNPLRAGRGFACFVQLGNPAGIWHIKRPPLDAKVRAYALNNPWPTEATVRLSSDELERRIEALGMVATKDSFTSRVSTDPLTPTLHDSSSYAVHVLAHHEPQVERCVAPIRLDWTGGAGHLEIRQGDGDELLFEGATAPGAVLTLRGLNPTASAQEAFFELPSRGRYRVRLYPAVKSFLDPPYEWWLDIQ